MKTLTGAERMMTLLREISPLQRLINGPGLDEAYAIVRRELPDAVIHEYAAGLECGDWIVRPSWRALGGFVEDRSGRRIASFDEHPLFVAAYSQPVDGWFSKQEIASHLRTRPDRPYAFALEHRYAYNFQICTWGISIPYDRWQHLPDGDYHVVIDVETGNGSMKVAEYLLPGRRPETICVCSHIDELCNDDLSGCVVGMELFQELAARSEREYSYQLLLVPEMVGSLFFAAQNRGRLAATVAMLNLEAVGAGREWLFKRSLPADTHADVALRLAWQESGAPFREVGFFHEYMDDERVYGWPSIGIPGVKIQRCPFAEYHTSDDTPDIVSPDHLETALDVARRFVDIVERDYLPQYTRLLPPWLTRHGLYYDCSDDPENFQKYNNAVLFGVDGETPVSRLAASAGLRFDRVHAYLERFVDQGFIEKLPIDWPARPAHPNLS